MLVIRQMRPQDADSKGYVHYTSWQETYPGLVDAAYLSQLRLDEYRRKARSQADQVVVAELDGKIVGFAMYGFCRDEDLADCGEVYAIYILREAQGLGIGRKLMDAALEKLSTYKTIVIWVLKGNDRAFGFYRHYGFCFEGTEKEIIIGTPNMEQRLILHR